MLNNNQVMSAVIEGCDLVGIECKEVWVSPMKVVFTTEEPRRTHFFLYSRNNAEARDIRRVTAQLILIPANEDEDMAANENEGGLATLNDGEGIPPRQNDETG